MPSALDIAGKKLLPVPAESSAGRRPTLNYSIYAAEMLRFLAFHRICFASQLCQALPHCFSSDRDARRHLETLQYVGEIDSVKYVQANHANVYIITDKGFSKARELCNLNSNALPSRYVEPNGDHFLHELLITDVGVMRDKFFRENPLYRLLWKERFGFDGIGAFDEVIPDYADAHQAPQGFMVDFVEVLSGIRSITVVKQKLAKWDHWWKTDAARQCLLALYRAFGAKHPQIAFRLTFAINNPNVVGTDAGWEQQILNATFSVGVDLQRRIWTTTIDSLRKTKAIDSPVWTPAAMLVPHRHQWADIPKRKQFRFTSSVLDDVRRLSLFPTAA